MIRLHLTMFPLKLENPFRTCVSLLPPTLTRPPCRAARAPHPSRVYSPGASARAAVTAQYSLHVPNRLHAASAGHGPPVSLAAAAPALLLVDASPVTLPLLPLSLRTP